MPHPKNLTSPSVDYVESTRQTSEQWQKVCALSSRLLDIPRADWDALLHQECGDNPALRARVLEICANYSEDDELLGVPVSSPLLWDDSLNGQRLGPWEVLRLLGEGGMGRVYLAQRADGVFTQYAALKINREHADPDAVRRFHSERRILAMLEHPAIARAIDGGATESGALYLVMEYVENGCHIDEFNPSAPVRDKIRLFLRVVDAVEAAHRLQIAHRDLKPSNILVTPAGQPKVLDFGIAKLIQPEAPAADQTDAANSALTPTYASPEQLLREPATLLSDIYSLGAVLYKMLAARPPHELTGLNLIQTVRKVTESEPAPPSTFVPGIGADLDAIIGKALARDPARRYASASDLAADLRCYLDGFPVAARKGAHWYRVSRFVRRHRGASLAAALCLTLLAVGGLKTARDWQLARQRHEQLRKTAPAVIAGYKSQLNRFTGNTALLNQIAADGKKYLDSIYPDAAQDSALRHDLAAAYAAVSTFQAARLEAHDSYKKAVSLRREILLDSGTDADRLQLAVSLRRLGWSAISMGQVAEANRALYEALPLLDTLRNPPIYQSAQYERITLYFELSRLGASSGDGAKAIEFAKKALEVHEKLPANPLARTSVVFTRLQLADTIETFASSDPQLNQLALTQTRLAVRAVREAPPCPDLSCREVKAAVLTRAPLILLHRHLIDEALALRDGVDLAEAILAEDPGNGSALTSLRSGLRSLGWLLDHTGRLQECLPVLRRYLEVSVVSGRDPGAVENLLSEALACSGLGRLLMRMNRLQEALGYFERQVEIVSHPRTENVYWFMRQTEAYQDLGRLRLRMGQPEAARAEFANGSAAAATFLAKTGSARAKAIQAELHFFHGDSLLPVDKPTGCALIRRSLDQYDELAKAAGTQSPEWKPTYDEAVIIFRKGCPAAKSASAPRSPVRIQATTALPHVRPVGLPSSPASPASPAAPPPSPRSASS